MSKILIIDDEINIINTLGGIFQDEGHEIIPFNYGEDAFNYLVKEDVDLILLDVCLPDCNGVELLKKIKLKKKNIPIIMISGNSSIDVAVSATKFGAFDFLEKPPSFERVITTVKNALEHAKLKKENIELKKDILGLREAREQFEKNFIISAIKKNEKNITAAASSLGIERTNLHRKIKQYGIDVSKF